MTPVCFQKVLDRSQCHPESVPSDSFIRKGKDWICRENNIWIFEWEIKANEIWCQIGCHFCFFLSAVALSDKRVKRNSWSWMGVFSLPDEDKLAIIMRICEKCDVQLQLKCGHRKHLEALIIAYYNMCIPHSILIKAIYTHTHKISCMGT